MFCQELLILKNVTPHTATFGVFIEVTKVVDYGMRISKPTSVFWGLYQVPYNLRHNLVCTWHFFMLENILDWDRRNSPRFSVFSTVVALACFFFLGGMGETTIHLPWSWLYRWLTILVLKSRKEISTPPFTRHWFITTIYYNSVMSDQLQHCLSKVEATGILSPLDRNQKVEKWDIIRDVLPPFMLKVIGYHIETRDIEYIDSFLRVTFVLKIQDIWRDIWR